jgi:2-keto-4-pentenoate hydratase/2-oxohepta-3-ene-1,7-dioic acid hydratase in catechol pathway
LRFLRLGPSGGERPAIADDDGRLLDLSPHADDIDARFLSGDGVERSRELVLSGELAEVEDPGARVGPPVARPGKIVGIGLNYRDHARETGAPAPREPIVFMKATSALCGPYDRVLLPPGSTKTDWEVELAVVIGRRASYLESPAASRELIAGFTIANDVSEREFQLERGGQWDKGKSCETFSPLGPWLVTPDEVGDPQDLGLRLWVNGVQRQRSSTGEMIFDVDHLVWYLSQFMVLEPGDVIDTGTPAGVALGSTSVPFLKDGDVMELEIDRLGRQRQEVGAA